MEELYKKAEQFVQDAYAKAGKEIHTKHALRTVHWIEKLTNPDLALKIAALCHDIEKAFRHSDMEDKKQSHGYTDLTFLRPHEERSAEIIKNFLTKQDANAELIAKVEKLVSRHEEGGDKEQNLLKDADSASFFEVYPERMLKKVEEVGKQKVKDKLEWMYNRIDNETIKEIVKQTYEKVIKNLEAL